MTANEDWEIYRSKIVVAAICMIVMLSFALNVFNNDFPVGYHFDEPKKVKFILTDTQDFHHPVLMLEAIRVPNLLLQLSEPEQVAVLGRSVMALFGSAICLLMFFVARQSMPIKWSLLVASAVAICPMIVIHSHYIKEDVPLATFCLLTVLIFSRYIKRPSVDLALLAGMAFGLAIATHYKGLLLIPVIGTFLCVSELKSIQSHLFKSVLFLAAGAFVFLLVNNAIIDDPATFWNGFNHERTHSIAGHDVPIRWNDFWMTYHLRYSVIPSMTWPGAVVGVTAFIWFSCRYRQLAPIEKLLLIFGWFSYMVPELSPLKPHPDECRYVLGLIPVLIYFGVKLTRDIYVDQKPSKLISQFVVWGGAICLAVVPAVDSALMCYHFKDDTRLRVEQYAKQAGIVYEYEPMAGVQINKPWGYAAETSLLFQQNVNHFACSSFSYDVYFLAKSLSNQPEYVTQRRKNYEKLFQLETTTFEPRYRSYSFTNPTIKLIRLVE